MPQPVWHEVIQRGNAHFAAGRYADALAAFDRALVMVDRLLAGCRIDVALLVSKIVTQRNRAETLVRLRRYADADEAFRQGHGFAQAIVEEEAFAENVRHAARCHCRMMFSEWRVFRCEHGHHLDDRHEPFFSASFAHSGTLATATVH
ncbi:MAG: hypothetical protein EA417_15890 [Gammaproteobacteria bacterium]|nr:MAG: hypothetical protein EA417_15890 [Gammaproteobacteria bacterium]